MLSNGNFNTGDTTGWWSWAPDLTNSSLTVANDAGISLDGSPYLYILARNPVEAPVLGQDPAVAPGSLYQIGFQYRGNNWGGSGVEIHYKDASWATIGWEWAQFFTGNGTDTGWQPFSTPFWTTPANTTYLEVRFKSWGWSDTYLDNVSLTIIPEPGSATLLGLGALAFLVRSRRA